MTLEQAALAATTEQLRRRARHSFAANVTANLACAEWIALRYHNAATLYRAAAMLWTQASKPDGVVTALRNASMCEGRIPHSTLT